MVMKTKNTKPHIFILTFFLVSKATRYMILLVLSRALKSKLYMGSDPTSNLLSLCSQRTCSKQTLSSFSIINSKINHVILLNALKSYKKMLIKAKIQLECLCQLVIQRCKLNAGNRTWHFCHFQTDRFISREFPAVSLVFSREHLCISLPQCEKDFECHNAIGSCVLCILLLTFSFCISVLS